MSIKLKVATPMSNSNKKELGRWLSVLYQRQNSTKLIKITEEKVIAGSSE